MKALKSLPLSLCFLLASTDSLWPQGILASHNTAKVDSIVSKMDSTGKLFWIQCGDLISLDGTCTSWYYWYMSTGPTLPPTHFYLHTVGDSVIFDSSSTYFPLNQLEFTWITKPWFDSDSAIVVAEQNGGAQFRMVHPSAGIVGTLLEPLNPNFWWPHWRLWYLALDSTGEVLVFNIDATDNNPNSVTRQATLPPSQIVLKQNYPNPFNPTTTISFYLPSRATVSLSIVDILGREIANIVRDETFPAGSHSMQWNASKFPSGVYFCRLQADAFTETKKLLLLR